MFILWITIRKNSLLDNGEDRREFIPAFRRAKKGRGIAAPATRQSSVLQLFLEVLGRKPPKTRIEYTCRTGDVNEKALPEGAHGKYFPVKSESPV
jgi:hypothetical protein